MAAIREGKVNIKENDFGVQDTLSYGLLNVKNQLSASHPLELQEKNRLKIEDENVMAQLRMSQGMYAPFKFAMERQAACKVGRLPCLKSSNLMLSVLRGTDDTIEVEDIFNNQREFCEHNTDPHLMMETRKH